MLMRPPRIGRARTLAALVAGSLAMLAGGAWGASTRVVYLAAGTVYVDAGSMDGLAPGDTVQVLHADHLIAGVHVAFVSSHRAAGDTLWTKAPIALGDEIRYRPHVVTRPTASPETLAIARASAPARAREHLPRLRGRVGARWLSVTTGDVGFQQPALDLRLNGQDQAGGHVDLVFDMRNRRTLRTGFGNTSVEQLSRVYQASMTVRSLDSRHSVSIGRQTSASLSSVSLFDGVVVRSGNDRHSYGIFSGTQPDPWNLKLSAAIVQSGLFYELHSAIAAERNYQLTIGGITSQNRGQANRDFLFTLANWSSRMVSSSFTQEVDWNRGWKRAEGEPALTPTSTFWNGRVTPMPWLGVSLGFDNRRNVRLWQDRITPADQFDEAYRQGTWVGSDVDILHRYRLTGEWRGNGAADHSHYWSGGAEAYRMTALHLSLRGRLSEYTASTVTSRLWSASVGVDPTALSHIEAASGVRGTRIAPATNFDRQTWESVDVDITLGRRWYVNGGWEQDGGGSGGESRQMNLGVNWRF